MTVIGHRITAVFSGDRKMVLGEVEDASKLTQQWRDGWMNAALPDKSILIVEELNSRKNRQKVSGKVLWTPFKPIKCLHHDCKWIGQTLSTHLRGAHHMSLAEYRDIYQYRGPAVVGNAALKLAETTAQRVERRSLTVGRLLVEVRGDTEVDVWKVVRRRSDGYELEQIASSNGDWYTNTVVPEATIYHRFKPVLSWDAGK